jgi:hypothetical protein
MSNGTAEIFCAKSLCLSGKSQRNKQAGLPRAPWRSLIYSEASFFWQILLGNLNKNNRLSFVNISQPRHKFRPHASEFESILIIDHETESHGSQRAINNWIGLRIAGFFFDFLIAYCIIYLWRLKMILFAIFWNIAPARFTVLEWSKVSDNFPGFLYHSRNDRTTQLLSQQHSQ